MVETLQTEKVWSNIFSIIFFQETSQKRSSCTLGNNDLIEKILAYGRELKSLSVELKQEHGTNPANRRALEVFILWCFGLLE